MSAVADMAPKSAAYLPAVFRDSPAVGHDPVHALLQAFEKDLFRAERIAADSGLLFDPDALDLLFDPDEVGSPTFPIHRIEGRRTGRVTERRPLRSELETVGDAGTEELSKTVSSESLKPAGWELGFLRWLASCVLLELDEEWLDEQESARQSGVAVAGGEHHDSRYAKVRRLIRNVASLYRERGTPRGLERTVKHFYDWDVEVIERSWPQGMRVGVNSSIGVDSWLVEEPDLETQFTVLVTASKSNLPRLAGVKSPIHLKLAAPAGGRDVWFLGPGVVGTPFLLTADDLKDQRGLVRKLRNQSDPISAYLWSRFTKATQEILAHGDPVSEQMQSALVSELNNILQGRSIYETNRFPTEMLSTETRALLAQKLEGERLVRLNRLLLSDAYPDEIAIDKVEGTVESRTETPAVRAQTAKSLVAARDRLRDLIDREKPAHTRFFLAVEVGEAEAAVAEYPWLRIGMSDDSKASLLAADDLKDVSGLVQKLVHHSDPVSLFLWNRFSQTTQDLLRQGAVSEQQTVIVEELNRVLQGESIYEFERFVRVRLSRETDALKDALKDALNSEDLKGSGPVRIRLNRLLLEDAYPQIARSLKTPSSIVGRFWIK